MSDFWSYPSSTSILQVCQQQRLWRDSPEPLLVAYLISTIISWAGSNKEKEWKHSSITFRFSTLIDTRSRGDRHHGLSYSMLPVSRLFQTLPALRWDNQTSFLSPVEGVFPDVVDNVLLPYFKDVRCPKELSAGVQLEQLNSNNTVQQNFLQVKYPVKQIRRVFYVNFRYTQWNR